MALRNQPYFPLYVQDYLTDEKLNMCTASSQGVYIKIMCILHKQKEYGKILIKQKDKQNSSSIKNFASVLSRLLPFNENVIIESLNELIEEEVLFIEGDYLGQKRMVKDGAISEARSNAGKKGGGNPKLFKQTSKQRDKQNSEYEYEIEDVNENENKKEKKAKAIYFDCEELNLLFIEHLKIRAKIKAVNSETAIKALISKLYALSDDINEQVQIVEQSIMNSWKSYFPLKIENNGKQISKAEQRLNTIAGLECGLVEEN